MMRVHWALGILTLAGCVQHPSSSSGTDTPDASMGTPDAMSGPDAMPDGTLPTTPPSDGHTPWAPAAGDPDWVDVVTVGAVGDAVTDDTAAFRSAAATGKNIFVPKPPFAYKLTGFVQLTSSIYGDGSMPEIRMYGADGDPNQGHTHSIFWIAQYSGDGLTISGLHLNGQWDGGTNGEWSHGVNIDASKNITVENSIIEKPYGDCVFIGQYASTMLSATPDTILVRNNVLSEPRRCNVAVVSGTNVTISDNTIQKTISNYVAAIDLEPDPNGYQHDDGVTISGNKLDVALQWYHGPAISLYDPPGNQAAPPCGNVTIENTCGTWVPGGASNDLVGLVGGSLPWSNLSITNNLLGSTGCGAK
jgi:hypothetical protein